MKITLSKMPNGKGEVYSAIQGEGPTLGKQVVFVRLAFCDMFCKFCDSAYTWYFEQEGRSSLPMFKHNFAKPCKRDENVVEMDTKEVAEEIIKLCGPHFKRVVFTGGEPMLQQKALKEIADILNKDYHHFDIEVETNGTISVLDETPFMTQINCSPKLASSGNPKALRDKPETIKKFLQLWRDAKIHNLCFKFVVSPETLDQDLNEILEWQTNNSIPNDLIWLMPEGITQERIAKGTDALMSICREKGYHLTTRLHILLYGSKKYT